MKKFQNILYVVLLLLFTSLYADEYAEGLKQIEQGNADVGVSYLKIARSKGNYKATYMLGLIYEKAGDYKLATKYFKEATEWGELFKSQKLKIFRQPSSSMQPTIMIGDEILAIKTKDIKHGDIVVFQPPFNLKTFYIKRCIALPGDKVMIKNKDLYVSFAQGEKFMKANYSNTIKIDDTLWVKNPYSYSHTIHHDASITKKNFGNLKAIFNFPITTIKDNEMFVMGDNRDHSNDSRFWGMVNLKNTKLYKPFFVIYSPEQARIGLELK